VSNKFIDFPSTILPSISRYKRSPNHKVQLSNFRRTHRLVSFAGETFSLLLPPLSNPPHEKQKSRNRDKLW
jgi:hypothetical protein